MLLTIEILAVFTLLEFLKLPTASRTLRQFRTLTLNQHSH